MSAKKQNKAKEDQSKILVVDDHPMVREGLVRLVENEPDLVICGQADDAPEALRAISETKPDIVILDIALKSSSGIELMKSIKAQYPKLPVLVLSMHNEALYAERALHAGAMGYIMKQEASEKLLTAIRRVLDGEIFVSDAISKRLIYQLAHGKDDTAASPVDSLSDRELEVFHLIGQGYGTSQIAGKLYLSIKTIETYRTHIKEKLNLADARELLQYAIQWVGSQKEI
ncbi:MAG: response regulator transcription factor [Planctomycetota bacterium]|jgi:DNA-binding NarL/FixJ family response regulator